jgi:hypothetical protein
MNPPWVNRGGFIVGATVPYKAVFMENLFIVRYPDTPIRIPDRGKLTIGRADGNTIVLTESRVSRKHAHIEWHKSLSMFVLSDLGSSNGTFLNGFKITQHDQHPLNDWDKIRIAATVFTLRFVNDTAVIKNEFKELQNRVHVDVTEIAKLSDLLSQHQPGFSGNLEHLCVVEILQMLETGYKTGQLSLKTDIGDGIFIFEGGKIIAAKFNEFTGKNAVYEVLKCTNGTFAFDHHYTTVQQPEISTSVTFLLMEGCKLIDEANAPKPSKTTAVFPLLQ